MPIAARRLLLALLAAIAPVGFAQTPVWRQLPVVPGGTNGPRHDDVQFTDAQNGWVSQNANIYHTTNGGVTWTMNFTKSGAHFRSVTFLTPQVGFAGNLGVGSYDGAVTDMKTSYIAPSTAAPQPGHRFPACPRPA